MKDRRGVVFGDGDNILYLHLLFNTLLASFRQSLIFTDRHVNWLDGKRFDSCVASWRWWLRIATTEQAGGKNRN